MQKYMSIGFLNRIHAKKNMMHQRQVTCYQIKVSSCVLNEFLATIGLSDLTQDCNTLNTYLRTQDILSYFQEKPWINGIMKKEAMVLVQIT